MGQIPTLITARLNLGPFTLDDAPRVRELAGERAVAEMTLNIPHPYEEGMAEAWIDTHQVTFDKGEAVTLGVTVRSDAVLVGAIGLGINSEHRSAEMGYWIGRPYWNQGYCTEAAQALLKYAFEELELNRVEARHMAKNPASGRVMQKIGMQVEGTMRRLYLRWGAYQDIVVYAILREEWSQLAVRPHHKSSSTSF